MGELEFFEEMNDHEWGVSTSAACGLKSMATLMKDDILEPVIQSQGANLTSSNPKDIYVGLLSLGSIIDGPSSAHLVDKFSGAMSILLDLLTHPNTKVSETCAWLFTLLA